MKNVLSILKDYYFQTILAAGIMLDGNVLKVYDGMAPSTELGSYILVGIDRGAIQTPDKCTYMWNANILVDCVVKNGNFGTLDSDNIANQVGLLINTRSNPDLSPDFQCFATVANFQNLQGLNQTEPIFRTLIRYQHKIAQVV